MSKQSRKAYWAKQTKKAWFQGQKDKSHEGEITSNNPESLGYPKEIGYSKQPMATTAPGGEDSRPWEQKWFEGAAAETEKVMGPKGSEFEEKKHWQRIPSDEKIANAKLSAKFKAVAKSPKNSSWTITADGKPILTATLGQIWGKELDEKTAKASITKEYAKSVMAKIRQDGLAHVAYLLTGVDVKKLQDKKAWYKEELNPEEAGEMGIDAGAAGALDDEAKVTETELGVAGDVAEEKLQEIEALEMQIIEKVAPSDPKAVEVFKGLQEAEEALEATASELKSIKAKLSTGKLSAAKKIQIIKLAEAAIADAVTTFEGADDMAEEGADLIPEGDMGAGEGAEGGAVEQAEHAIEEAHEFLEGGEGSVEEGAEMGADLGGGGAAEVAPVGEPVAEAVTTLSSAKIKNFVAARKARRQALAAMKEETKYHVEVPGEPKDGRGEIDRAHPEGGHRVSDLTAGGTPSTELDKFETQNEAQDIDLKVAEKMPKGTYTAKANGKTVKASDSSTAADAEAKSYWVDYFSQMGPEGKAYGQALVSASVPTDMGKTAKALVEKQVTSAVEVAKAKLLRANELVELAAQKGVK